MSDQTLESNKLTRKKLLIIGPTAGSVHVKNFYFLVRDYFDEVLIACNGKIDFAEHRVMQFSVKNPLKVFSHVRKLRRLIQEFKPDLIHVHQSNTLAYIAVRANQGSVPLVLTCWGSDILLLPHRNFLMKKIVTFSLKRARAITVDAGFMKHAVEKLAGRKDTSVINFGIDLEENLVIPEKQNIIYSNRLHKKIYNIDRIILGFEEFLRKNHNWKLILGGNGELTPELIKLAESRLPKESFEFIGFVGADENRRYFLNSKIWISVPSSDGTSVSLLEAMAYGCIPVVSDLPANREWIIHGQNGTIAIGGDVARALEEALKLSDKEVGDINHKIIAQRATKDSARNSFYKIYDSLLTN